jgi:aminoglycoside 2'-N-acetyltransferase I
MAPLRQVTSDELRPDEVEALRDLFDGAWTHKDEVFTEDDFRHAFGGVHFLMEDGPDIVGHASVVPRELRTGDHRLATGYVEAVATRPDHQRRGIGTALMREVGALIDRTYELGALDTGIAAFYERLGWTVWAGPTFVWMDVGPRPTPDEDGSVLILRTAATPELDPASPLMCEWRSGDVW